MSRAKRGLLAGTALTAIGVLVVGGVAASHPISQTDGGVSAGDGPRHAHQHGATEGHLSPEGTKSNVDLVSKLKLKNVVPEKIADVGVHNGYAYLAAWGSATCKYNGVHVVDIRDVNQPKEVAFIASKEGSYPGEGVQVVHIDTPAFTGDILVTNNEKCKDKAGFGGANIYDVTNPAHPTPLVEGIGDFTVNGQGKKDSNETHSAYAWDAGDKAYAVIVDNEEGSDVDILDITDPKKAKLVAEYDLDQKFPQIRQAAPVSLDEIFLHDMVVKQIGGRQVMLLSYWDAGYVKVDVTDPLNISYLGDTDFASPDPEAAESGLNVVSEGNGHQAEFTKDNAYVIGSDEDFSPYVVQATNLTEGVDISANQGGNKPLAEGQTVEGVSVFVGRACSGDPAVPAGDPNVVDIAVVERGVCTFTEKVTSVTDAGGYDAVLIFNRVGSDACDSTLGMDVAGDIHTFGVIARQAGFSIFGAEGQYDDAACMAAPAGSVLAPIAIGARGDTLRFRSQFDGWGYVHLYDNSGGKMAELDTYAVPEAHDPAYARGFGDLSVHEVATSAARSDLAYFSYYSAGFRVAKIAGGKLTEVGHFIDVGGSNIWGVEVFTGADGKEYVAASDRDSGLYIFRYTGP